MEAEHNFLGMLRLKVEKGEDLAIRDRMAKSSDPYVVLNLGSQRFKTKVIQRNRNPLWDEKFVFEVEDPNVPLRIEVFDHDWYTPDDPMGHAEIDLRPLIEVGDQNLSNVRDGTVIQAIAPSDENHFAQESNVYWYGRKVMQDVRLRLQNVESGEIAMKLTWGKFDQRA